MRHSVTFSVLQNSGTLAPLGLQPDCAGDPAVVTPETEYNGLTVINGRFFLGTVETIIKLHFIFYRYSELATVKLPYKPCKK